MNAAGDVFRRHDESVQDVRAVVASGHGSGDADEAAGGIITDGIGRWQRAEDLHTVSWTALQRVQLDRELFKNGRIRNRAERSLGRPQVALTVEVDVDDFECGS